jgi:hypothetical protein
VVERKSLSVLPLIAAIACFALSCLLCLTVIPNFGNDTALPSAIVGYVLTPFGAAAALIWAQSLDLKLQGNPAYRRLDGRKRVRVIGLIAIASFIPAVIHILYIASYIGSLIS